MELNFNQILEYQKNRPPYLMIDHVTKVVPGKSAEGYKFLKNDEWFFKVHWENDPNMPGMLQVEALVQMCAMSIFTLDGNKGKTVLLANVNNVKFKKKIIPGDKLNLKTEIKLFKRGIANCYGEGYVNDDLALKAEFTVVLTEETQKYISQGT